MRVVGLACLRLMSLRLMSVGLMSVGLMSVVFAHPAEALTISNADPAPHTITVTVGSDSKELTVPADQDVDAACADGCKVKLENGEEYELKGSESVSIEDGVIFVDSSPDADDQDIPDIDPDSEQPADSGAPAGDKPAEATPPADSATPPTGSAAAAPGQ
jgi:hypothetical protein